MSDPIADIIHKCIVFPRTGCATDAAKQIRQQIGRESLDFVDSILWFEEAEGECDAEQALSQIFNLCREYKGKMGAQK